MLKTWLLISITGLRRAQRERPVLLSIVSFVTLAIGDIVKQAVSCALQQFVSLKSYCLSEGT